MLKYIIGIIISLVAFSFMRAVMGIIAKVVTDEVKSAVAENPPPETAGNPTTLRKCVTCGTYKPEPAMMRYGSGDKSVFFCSAECEAKART